MTTRDWAIIVALGAVFGSSFLFNEILLREIGPLSISFARVTLGAVTVWAIVAVTGGYQRMARGDLMQTALFGTFMFATPLAVYPFSQQWITGGLAGIINAMTPLVVVVVSHYWRGGERATVLKVVGVLCGLLGIVILSAPGLVAPGQGQVAGIAVALLAPLSYAVALNQVRRMSDYRITIVVAIGMTWAAALMLPIMLIFEGVPQVAAVESWVSLAIIGPVLTGWLFLAALMVMRRVGPTASSTLTFIAPISALLLGSFLLGEAVGLSHVAGMIAIFLGLFFIDGRAFRKQRAAGNSQPDG